MPIEKFSGGLTGGGAYTPQQLRELPYLQQPDKKLKAAAPGDGGGGRESSAPAPELHVYEIEKDGKTTTVEAPSAPEAAAMLGTTVFESTVTRGDAGCIPPKGADVSWSGPTPATEAAPKTREQAAALKITAEAPAGEGVEAAEAGPEPVMARLEASREWVKRYGPIPPSGSSGTEAYKAGVTAIQFGAPSTYTPIKVITSVYKDVRGGFHFVESGTDFEVPGDWTLHTTEEKVLTQYQVESKLRAAGEPGTMAYAEALIKYGPALGLEVPTDSIPVRDATGEVLVVSEAAWDAMPEEYRKIVTTQGLETLQQHIIGTLPVAYKEVAEAEGLEAAMAAYSEALEGSPSYLQQIEDFARDKGVRSDDFVSLYYAGLNIDVFRRAYPGNGEYFDGMERTLEDLRPHVEEQPRPGVFIGAYGSLPAIHYVPDLVAARASGNVTADALSQLGYSPKDVKAAGDMADTVLALIAKYDEGVQPRGEGLMAGLGLSGAELTDLSTAFREAGVEIEEGSAVYTWREALSEEDKVKVAQVLAGYPSLGHPLVSLHRAVITPAEDAPTWLSVGVSLITAPAVAVTTPFVKNITVGELRSQLEPYATYDDEGKVSGFDLTRCLEDRPYDAPLLARGGFSPEDIEKAQEGEQVNAMPQGATSLDWLIFGAVVATFALPAIRGGTMALFGPKGPLHSFTMYHVHRATVATLIYKGAALGEVALRVGFPVGMTLADIIYWKDWTPEQRIVAGIFTGLSYIPVLGPLYRAGRTGVQYARSAMSRTPAVPGRALTTGFYDLYPVTTPRSFFAGLSPEMRAQVYKIVVSNMAPGDKIAAVSKLLEPTETAPAFLEVLGLRSLTAYSVPQQYQGGALQAFESVPGMTHDKALRLLSYLAQNPDVQVGGSVAMRANGFRGIEPHDLDVVVEGTDARVRQVAEDLTRILGREVSKDVKRLGQYPPAPYDLTTGAAPPVVIDGVRFVSAGELVGSMLTTVTSPGLEGLMGPGAKTLPKGDFAPEVRVGTHPGRIPDYHKLQTVTRQIIEQLEGQGRAVEAREAAAHLKAYEDWLRTFETEGLETLPLDEATRLRQEVLELVREAQYQLLEQGRDVVVLDPRGKMVIAAVASPANEFIPGAIILVTPDIAPNIEMANVQGKFSPTDEIAFFSPKAALTYTYGTEGKLGANPGLNIVLTDPKTDIGPGGVIQGVSRYEYVTHAFFGEVPVIYDELTSGVEFLATPKTALSYELGVETGAMWVHDPVSGRKLPALVWRTPAAVELGRVAPTLVETRLLTGEAFKSALRSLAKPHMRDVTFTEPPTRQRASLFWLGDKPYDLRKATAEDLRNATDAGIRETVDQAIANLEAQGKPLTEKNILAEVQGLLDAKIAEAQTASVPTMITQGMRARLSKLGYSDKAIDVMKPQGAWDVLNAEKATPVPPASEAGEVSLEVRRILGGLDTRSRADVAGKAAAEYDAALDAVIRDWESGRVSLGDTRQRLYYLNLGMLSLRLAEAALATSMLSVRATPGTTMFLPVTSTIAPSAIETVFTTPAALTTPTPLTEILSVDTPVLATTPVPVTTTPALTTTITPIDVTTPPPPPTTGIVTTPPLPPPPVTITPTYRPRRRIRGGAEEQLKEAHEKGLTILLWRQGALGGKDVWKAVVDPEKQKNLLTVVGTEKLPVVPRKYATGPGSAQATMQWIGKGPQYEGSADLGIVDIFWGPEGTDLRFEGKGLETVVGERLPSPTVGISIPGASRLKFGTTFSEALAYVPVDEAQGEFIEERIRGMLPGMSSEEIAQQLKDADLSNERVEEILAYVPDQQRGVVAVLLRPKYYVKVGPGFEFAETSARPALEEAKSLEAAEQLGVEEEKALYTEEELKQMKSEALSKIPAVAPKNGEKEMAEFLLEVKVL